ncbi:MAG: DUF1553 domain-containing protein [Planctomycetota bacterium]
MRRVFVEAALAWAALGGGAGVLPVAGQESVPPDGAEFFERRIRPVLADKCYKCHSAKAGKVKADLALDTREGLLRGGESGPAIVPGDPDRSLLIRAIRYTEGDLEMPPKEADRLTPEQVRDFERWVKMGAPDPRGSDATPPAAKPKLDFAEARKFWSYRPVQDPPLPAVRDRSWPESPIDFFILAKLEEKGLRPAPDADKRTLLRRVSFDLTGLPPTPEQMEAFLADDSPDAFAKVVERLLASPHYGERWGRHWLDVVRYADTAGCNSDYPIPQMYRYRNWVIQAFNEDKPYGDFIREQLAGDLLPWKNWEERNEKVIATGYIANSRRFASSENGIQHLIIEDTIDNLGRTFLGLTIHCARCHDHKFDAISNEDYYALYGIFQSTRYPFPGIELNKVPRDLVPLVPPEEVERILAPHRERLAALEAQVKRLEAEQAAARKVIADEEEARKAAGVPPAPPPVPPAAPPPAVAADPALARRFSELAAAEAKAKQEAARLETERRALVAEAERSRRIAEARRRLEELRGAIKEAQKKREEYAKAMPLVESAYAVAEEAKPANARIHVRGDPKNLGPEVPRRFLSVLGGQELASEHAGSGRRELAEWIADPRNPLTWRVMANRIWQYHFGRGIVATPNDFGVRGQAPTHPELLDWLTRRFLESGGSVKDLHRRILLSRTYRMSSRADAAGLQADPENAYLWRFPRRRLEAESIRDALLAVAGTLDRTPGGAHPFPPQNTWNFTQHRPFIAVYETARRSVYVMTQRIRRHPFFALFDGPDPNASTAVRTSSTTPLQGLFMLNDPFVHEQARAFAARLRRECAGEDERIERAYLLAFGRPPSSKEREAARTFLAAVRARLGAAGVPEERRETEAWESTARVLFRLNEFIYVD